ncbi:MAG: Site-specific integrase [Candidatus Poribacteria bacterium]|nr:Site-specific integrase [Candidatus Poribacteria bacterium]
MQNVPSTNNGDYLVVQPPTSDDIFALCQHIENYGRDQYIDGIVLANVVRLCFFVGFRLIELINLKIRDINRNGEIVNEVEINTDKIILSEEARDIIQNHIVYLRNNGYETTLAQPLFPITKKSFFKSRSPKKNKSRHYTKPTIWRHLGICTNGNFPGFEKIQQAGICYYYETLKQSGDLNSNECLRKTAAFARYSEDHTKSILRHNNVKLIVDEVPQTERRLPTSIYDFNSPFIMLSKEQYIQIIDSSRPLIFNEDGKIKCFYTDTAIILNENKQSFFTSLKFNKSINDQEKEEIKKYFEDKLW